MADEFLAFVGDAPLVAHNAGFYIAFLNAELKRTGRAPIATERVSARRANARCSCIDKNLTNQYQFQKSNRHQKRRPIYWPRQGLPSRCPSARGTPLVAPSGVIERRTPAGHVILRFNLDPAAEYLAALRPSRNRDFVFAEPPQIKRSSPPSPYRRFIISSPSSVIGGSSANAVMLQGHVLLATSRSETRGLPPVEWRRAWFGPFVLGPGGSTNTGS
jgi:hypothetical protein